MAGPAVIADAFDLYADQLYAYCRFLVRDPADAVDALEDVFLVAAGRGAALPPDAQMRTWLFAVARNECLRSIRSRRTEPGQRSGPGEPADGHTERALISAAAGGLAPGDRDLVALLWHGLDADDIAAVFGIGREETFAQLDRALIQLEAAASALLVARSGRHGCASLAGLLRGWDGRLSVPLTRKLTQHIERCRACSARRQDGLRPALLLSLTPAALLGAGVSAEALRPAAATVAALRGQVLSLACDPSGQGAEARACACAQAGPFDTHEAESLAPPATGLPRVGFPVPLVADPGRHQSRARLVVAATGTAAVAVAVTAAVIAGSGQARTPGTGVAGLNRNSASAVTITGTSVSPSASASASASSAAPTPSASASATPSSSPTMTPSRTASASAALPPSAKPTPTLSAPSNVTLQWNRPQGELEGTLSVTVNGGSAQWSISNPNPGLQLSQSSGTTSASVKIAGRSRSPQPLTVTSGNISITVTLSVSYQGN